MNIWGHNKAIKDLQQHEKFWNKVTKAAYAKKFYIEERICQRFLTGERRKIKWHKEQIEKLKGNKEELKRPL